MAFVVIENDGEHENTLFETSDVDAARGYFDQVCAQCKAGTYDFYCAFDELEDGLTISLEDTESGVEEPIAEETFNS